MFLIHVSFSFLRSKQKQQQNNGNGFSDSPSLSSHNNSQTPEMKSSRSPEPQLSQMNDLSDTGDNNPDLDSTDNAIVDNSPPLVLTQSTIDTLNSMTTEEIQKEDDKEHSKGFVISFGPETAVKPRRFSSLFAWVVGTKIFSFPAPIGMRKVFFVTHSRDQLRDSKSAAPYMV